MNSLNLILQSRLVVIVRLDDLRYAHSLISSLIAGGICALELTLTNRDSLRVVREAIADFPQFTSGHATIGIGSVRNAREAQEAIDCGAQFLVSPIVHPEVIALARQSKVPIMPGAMTPTEMATAWDLGADIVKVFPAKSLGPGYIRDCLAPMPYLKLMPTGGVDLANAADYFAAGAVALGMGGQLLDKSAIARGDWAMVEQIARQHVDVITQSMARDAIHSTRAAM